MYYGIFYIEALVTFCVLRLYRTVSSTKDSISLEGQERTSCVPKP